LSSSNAEFPVPQESDSDDVATALQTATVLWISGDAGEAVRWLRRAASAAEEAGDDMRAVSLARAAADFASSETGPPPPVEAAAPAAEAAPPKPLPTAPKRPPPQPPSAQPAAVAPEKPAPPKAAPAAEPEVEPERLPVMQVSIKPSVRDEKLFMVRLLGEGESPPAGTVRALVVLLDRDA
jgi:uncharacterized membrane protein